MTRWREATLPDNSQLGNCRVSPGSSLHRYRRQVRRRSPWLLFTEVTLRELELQMTRLPHDRLRARRAPPLGPAVCQHALWYLPRPQLVPKQEIERLLLDVTLGVPRLAFFSGGLEGLGLDGLYISLRRRSYTLECRFVRPATYRHFIPRKRRMIRV